MRETLDEVEGRLTKGLQSMKKHFRDYVLDSLGFLKNKLTRTDDALEAIVIILKEEIVKLKGELKIYKASLGNRMMASRPK